MKLFSHSVSVSLSSSSKIESLPAFVCESSTVHIGMDSSSLKKEIRESIIFVFEKIILLQLRIILNRRLYKNDFLKPSSKVY